MRASRQTRGITCDFTGCEIRVAAALSGDRGLLEAEASPKCWRCFDMCTDVKEKDCPTCGPGKGAPGLHWMAAIEAFSKEASKEHRYWCKRVIFSKLFGGSAAAGARQVGIPLEDSQRIHSAFEVLAPVYAAWDQWLRQCYFEGSLVYRDFETGTNYSQPIDGRRRGIYRAYSGRQIYINAPHAFGNYAIQGTARELLVDGLLKWSAGPWGDAVLMPVHDEILAYVPADEAEEAVKYLQQCMRTDVLSVGPRDEIGNLIPEQCSWPVVIDADADKPFVSWPDSS